jgi:hypothetical protein
VDIDVDVDLDVDEGPVRSIFVNPVVQVHIHVEVQGIY